MVRGIGKSLCSYLLRDYRASPICSNYQPRRQRLPRPEVDERDARRRPGFQLDAFYTAQQCNTETARFRIVCVADLGVAEIECAFYARNEHAHVTCTGPNEFRLKSIVI